MAVPRTSRVNYPLSFKNTLGKPENKNEQKTPAATAAACVHN